MLLQIFQKIHFDKRISILIFIICFTVFVFTNDGHRYTFDEDLAYQQSYRIATWANDPSYIQGESRLFFEYPWLYPVYSHEYNQRVVCQNGILCSSAFIFHSVTQVPFIFLNHTFNFILDDTIIWTTEDFIDVHYVWWRNSLDPDSTFLELFYGPLFTALSVSVLFIICRSYGISVKNSILVSFIYGFSTIAWAYSQTSLSSPVMVFFALLGFHFFKNWKTNDSPRYLIVSGTCFGLAFLTRFDAVLFIIPVFFFILYLIKAKKEKIKSLLGFIIPTFSAYGIKTLIEYVRGGLTGAEAPGVDVLNLVAVKHTIPAHEFFEHLFGLFFSPGGGLFIFCPVLIGIFVGFFDFYKKNKSECILLLGFVFMFILQFARGDYWHGFNGWSVRYFVPLIPFLLIPIAFSLEKRGVFFKLSLVILGALGFFINLVYLLQDTHWFVWGFFGDDTRGLYSLARKDDGGVHPIWISPLVIWTFEYSQLTQSVAWLINKLQADLFLLKLLGIQFYIITLLSLLAIPVYLLRNTLSKLKLDKSL